MPIYEYQCRKCGHTFEELVFGDDMPACPACHATDTEKLLSRCSCRLGGSGAGTGSDAAAAPSGGGCSGCSGGNCSCCGH